MTSRRQVRAIVAGCALFVLLTGWNVNAQPADARPRTQLGGSAGVVFFLPTFGAWLSVPFRPPLTLETSGAYMPLTFEDDGAAWFLVQAQFRHRLNRGQAWRIHATYGATLFAKYTHRREFRQSRQDGSVIVFPEYRRMQLLGPAGVHGGLGAERSLSGRVVARWDVQVLMVVGERSIPVPQATFGFAWQRGSRR